MKEQRNFDKIRKRVVKKALEGANKTQLARQYMDSTNFIYKWIGRYMEDPTGAWWKERPRASKNPKRKLTPEIQERILHARKKWGLNIVKIAVVLQREGIKLSYTTI